jgi:hypothetical protein
MEATTFLLRFLPDAIPLHLDSWQLDGTAPLITLHATSAQPEVPGRDLFGIRAKTGHKNAAEDLRAGKTTACMMPKFAFPRRAARDL